MSIDPKPTPPTPPPVKDVVTYGWLALLTGLMLLLLVKAYGPPAPAPIPPAPAPVGPIAFVSATVSGPAGRAIPLEVTTDGALVKWWTRDSEDITVMLDGGSKKATFVAPAPGVYTVLAYTSIKGLPTAPATCVVTVGDAPPGPTPGPTPTPTPAPLRVLMVYDSSQTIPAAQQKAMRDPAVIAYLESHCVKDGTQPAYRIWEKGTQITNESDVWKAAFARPRASLPWIMVGNGNDGVEAPLPADSAGLLALLKKYGGS